MVRAREIHTPPKKIATSIAETKNGYLMTVKLNHNISIYRLPGEHITAKRFFHNALFYLVKAKLWWEGNTDAEKYIETVFYQVYHAHPHSPTPKMKNIEKSLHDFFNTLHYILWE